VTGQAFEKGALAFLDVLRCGFCNVATLAVVAINAAATRKVRVIPYFPFSGCAADANGYGADAYRPMLKRAERSLSTARRAVRWAPCRMPVLSQSKVLSGHAPSAAAGYNLAL
jgi:hypothetical protein